LLGGGFVVLGWKWPSVGTQIPLACLLLGSLSAVAATLMGWSFAPERGYGTTWNPLDWSSEADVHRWSGLIVTIASVVFALIALRALWKDDVSLTKVWKVGLLLLAGMVGAVGHQGGELNYGEQFYPKAFGILWGTDGDADEEAAEPTDAEKPTAESQLGESQRDESERGESKDAKSTPRADSETSQ
ncbi:MAG: cytochrome C, partial [Pirellulales bacterium]|nr:cytochrome C [Pirellulales bacterium]